MIIKFSVEILQLIIVREVVWIFTNCRNGKEVHIILQIYLINL